MSISLVTVETKYHYLAKQSLEHALNKFKFDQVVIFSNQAILPGATHINIDHFATLHDFSKFMISSMSEYINTDFILFVQWDALINDTTSWDESFLSYDYIGAPWPWKSSNRRVGNGGFSLRSKKLLDALVETKLFLPEGLNEDEAIGDLYRPILETEKGIKFATEDHAAKFSYELGLYKKSFGCHGIWNVVRFADDDLIESYINHLDYSSWNLYKWHHFLYEITRKKRLDWFEYATVKLQTHSPDLFEPVIQWLSKENFTQDLY